MAQKSARVDLIQKAREVIVEGNIGEHKSGVTVIGDLLIEVNGSQFITSQTTSESDGTFTLSFLTTERLKPICFGGQVLHGLVRYGGNVEFITS